MPSTYSSNLKLELMATGENSGTWGNITNTNLGTAAEQAIVGYGAVSYASDANLTISITNSNAAQAARALVLNVTSAVSLTGTRELVVPTIEKQYIVQNNTTGSQSITVKTSAGTGITVPNGRKAHLYVNGTDVIQMFDFVDINGGAIDGTTIGAASASTGAFTTLNASGATTLDGNVALGNASGDLITFPGTINSHLLFTDNTYDIGASGATRPRNLFLAGAATIGGNLSVGGTLTLTGGLILNGNVTVGDTSADTLTINATITSNLIFTDNTYDIGASGATRPRNLFLSGSATIGGNQTLTGSLTVDSTTDSSSTTTGSIQTDGGLGIAKALVVGTQAGFNGASIDTSFGVTAGNGFKSFGDGKGLRLLNTAATGGGTISAVAGASAGIVIGADAGPLVLESGGATTLTLSNTQAATFAGAVTLNTGTANGVGYLNASKVLTTGSALTFDGTNFATTGGISSGTFLSVRGAYDGNSTTMQLNSNSTTLSANNFFTINNRGTGTTQTNNYLIGGILFGGYRDVRNPANVAAVYAERVNSSGGLSSLGRLFLSTGEGSNIAQDGMLPNTAYALLNEGGDWLIGTTTSGGRLTVNNSATGAVGLGSFTSGNGTSFQIASAGSIGQYMASSAVGDVILREVTNSLCLGSNGAIKFGNVASDWGRFDSSGRFMLGVASSSTPGIKIGNQYGGVDLAGGGGSYANWGGGYGIWPWNNVGLGIGSAAAIGFYVNGNTDAGRFESGGSFKVSNSTFKEQDNYNIYLRNVSNFGNLGYAEKFFNSGVGSGDDPGRHYVALCRAYDGGGGVNKSYFLGQIIWSRGDASAGNSTGAVQVFIAGAYLSNTGGGTNFGDFNIEIVKFTAGGIAWLGVRAPTISSAGVTVIGCYASSQAPTLYLDAAVSSVTVLKTLVAAT